MPCSPADLLRPLPRSTGLALALALTAAKPGQAEFLSALMEADGPFDLDHILAVARSETSAEDRRVRSRHRRLRQTVADGAEAPAVIADAGRR